MLPGDVATGKTDPLSDEGLQRALNFTANLGGIGTAGGMALGKPSPNVASMFGGTGARNFPHYTYASAKNEAPEALYALSGVFHNPIDMKPRFEIPDVKAQLSPHLANAQDTGTLIASNLSDILIHPELYDNYPNLANIPTIVKSGAGNRVSGSFNPDTGEIRAYGPSPQDVLSTLLHESQHAIQDVEGFAPGGSVEGASDLLARLAPNVEDQLSLPQPFDIYSALAGEVEARNVQMRSKLNTLYPNKNLPPPAATQGIPYNKQINPELMYALLGYGTGTKPSLSPVLPQEVNKNYLLQQLKALAQWSSSDANW